MTSSIAPSSRRFSLRTFTFGRSVHLLVAVFLLAFGAVACGGTEEGGGEATVAGTAPEAPESVPPAGEAEGFEPITSHSDADGGEGGGIPTEITPADGTAIQAPGVSFHLPAEWRNEAPSSSMRMAQAAIPGEAGEGQLTVFYFGPGGGGGVDANIDRWVGQVQLDPGTLPRRIRMDLEGGLVAHWVEVEGTLQPSMMGTGPTEAQPGSRLQGAVVEGPQGPWFFKATGPSETLDAQRDAFFSMLRSLKPSA